MPITPLHAGPGVLLKAACPTMSLLTFLVVQVFIDVEPLIQFHLFTPHLLSPLHALYFPAPLPPVILFCQI